MQRREETDGAKHQKKGNACNQHKSKELCGLNEARLRICDKSEGHGEGEDEDEDEDEDEGEGDDDVNVRVVARVLAKSEMRLRGHIGLELR